MGSVEDYIRDQRKAADGWQKRAVAERHELTEAIRRNREEAAAEFRKLLPPGFSRADAEEIRKLADDIEREAKALEEIERLPQPRESEADRAARITEKAYGEVEELDLANLERETVHRAELATEGIALSALDETGRKLAARNVRPDPNRAGLSVVGPARAVYRRTMVETGRLRGADAFVRVGTDRERLPSSIEEELIGRTLTSDELMDLAKRLGKGKVQPVDVTGLGVRYGDRDYWLPVGKAESLLRLAVTGLENLGLDVPVELAPWKGDKP